MTRIGNIQLSSQDFYALLAVILILAAILLNIPIPYIGAQNLLFLAIVYFIARAFGQAQLISFILFILLLVMLLRAFLPIPYFPLILLIFVLLLLFGFFGRG